MNQISYQTALEICYCHREIENSEKLLKELREIVKEARPPLRDAFGRERGFQLGVPSGESAHRLFDVNPRLSLSIIEAHIANKKAELATWNEKARAELIGSSVPSVSKETPVS